MAEPPKRRGKRNIVSHEEVYAALRRAGFDRQAATKMTAVAGAESNYDLGALRPSNASGTLGNNMHGLFQISDIHKNTSWWKKDADNWQDLDAQARMAYAVYKAQGLTRNSWASYGNDRYQKELPAAQRAAAKIEKEGIGKTDPSKSGKGGSGKGKDSGGSRGSTSKSPRKDRRSDKASESVLGGIELNRNRKLLLAATAFVVILVMVKK